jgi:hypothetical protein
MTTNEVGITVHIKFTISVWDAFKLRLCGCKSRNLVDALRLKIDESKETDK